MLLPFKYKMPGYILIFIGLILSILFFTINFRFQIPVLVLVSSYMETRFFTIFNTNFADELIFISLLTGFSLVAFSREKSEKDFYNSLRLRALVKTVITNTVFMIFSVLFIFGSAFMGIIVLNIFLPFIVYLVFFNFMRRREIAQNN